MRLVVGGRYRRLLETARDNPPLIPFFPMLMKDLAFMHEGNPTKVDGLINFDKLRMLTDELCRVESHGTNVYDSNTLLMKSSKLRRDNTLKAAWQNAQVCASLCCDSNRLQIHPNPAVVVAGKENCPGGVGLVCFPTAPEPG